MENKSLKILTLLVIILSISFVAFIGYHFYEKAKLIDNKENVTEETNSNITNNKEKELLSSLEGTWYNCETNSTGYKNCTVHEFYNNEYHAGQYRTGNGYGGEIKAFFLLEKNKYVLVVYDPGCSGNDCIDEENPEYYTLVIDTTNISKKIININETEVKYAAKDREEVEEIIDSIY